MQQPGDPSFEQLLVSARKGDAAAIEALLGRYRNYLGVLARVRIDRKLQAKFDESDVVQETMIQANRDFREFRGPCGVRPRYSLFNLAKTNNET